MKKLLTVLLLAGIGQTAFAAGIDVDDAWARSTVQGMSMGGVFMEIENENKADDVLLGGTTPVADKVEIHTHVNDNGVMRMREVQGGLPLPANREVALKPGSYHVMLIDLNKPLAKGEIVPITLKVEGKDKKVEAVEVKAEVRELTAPAPMEHRH